MKKDEQTQTTRDESQQKTASDGDHERKSETAVASQERRMPSIFGSGLSSSPFGMMRRMMQDMERMFEDFGFGQFHGSSLEAREPTSQSFWAPHVEVLQQNGDLVVRADLPGMKENDIRVEIMNHTLVLDGERKSEQREERGGVLRSEVSYGSFHRAIPLPEGVDVDSAKASFENGVLQVALKLPEQHQAKRIAVKGASSAQFK
jgi:HSP20 family protein